MTASCPVWKQTISRSARKNEISICEMMRFNFREFSSALQQREQTHFMPTSTGLVASDWKQWLKSIFSLHKNALRNFVAKIIFDLDKTDFSTDGCFGTYIDTVWMNTAEIYWHGQHS